MTQHHSALVYITLIEITALGGPDGRAGWAGRAGCSTVSLLDIDWTYVLMK